MSRASTSTSSSSSTSPSSWRLLVAALATIATIATIAIERPAHATAADVLGIGMRSPAMGGTGAADAAGYEANYLNPAGLVDPSPRRLTLGYSFARYRVTLDGAPRDVESSNGVVVAGAIPLPLGGAAADRVGIGISFYFPAGIITRARNPLPSDTRAPLLDSRTQAVNILACAAVRLHERLSVGAGALVQATLIGEVRIAPDASGRIGTVSEQQLIAAYSPVVGARVELPAQVRLGATFRGESRVEYDIRITNNLGNRLPIEIPLLIVAGVAQYDPMQAALEAAWRPRPWLTLAAGATWKHWSAYPFPSRPATVGAEASPSPGFKDTVVPRAGVELTWARRGWHLAGRAGYFFEPTPAPADKASVLVDADRHGIGAGGGVSWRGAAGGFAIDGYLQWQQLAGDSRLGGGLLGGGIAAAVDL